MFNLRKRLREIDDIQNELKNKLLTEEKLYTFYLERSTVISLPSACTALIVHWLTGSSSGKVNFRKLEKYFRFPSFQISKATASLPLIMVTCCPLVL